MTPLSTTTVTNGGAMDHSDTLDCHDALPQRLGGRPLCSCVSQRQCCTGSVADTYGCDSNVFAVYPIGRVTNTLHSLWRVTASSCHQLLTSSLSTVTPSDTGRFIITQHRCLGPLSRQGQVMVSSWVDALSTLRCFLLSRG